MKPTRFSTPIMDCRSLLVTVLMPSALYRPVGLTSITLSMTASMPLHVPRSTSALPAISLPAALRHRSRSASPSSICYHIHSVSPTYSMFKVYHLSHRPYVLPISSTVFVTRGAWLVLRLSTAPPWLLLDLFQWPCRFLPVIGPVLTSCY